MNNRLVFAPVDFTISNLRILDSCTSDGYWLRDLQDDVDKDHKHSFFGVDIDDTRFPSNLPQGVTLQVQDVNKPWPSEWKKSFDLVHMRFGILAAGSTPHAVIDSLLSLVKPGGWFQSVEPEFSSTEEDPLAARQYIDLLNELQAVRGMTGVVPQIPRWMEEAGFVDVHEEMITFSMGAKSSDPHIAGISMKSTAVAIEGLVARVRCECT